MLFLFSKEKSMSDLDKLKGAKTTKDYDLKTLKANSNTLVAKAMEAMNKFMDDPEQSNKDKAAMGFKIIQNHIIVLDKNEKIEFLKLQKSNMVLQNNKLLKQSLEDNSGGDYKKLVDINLENSNSFTTEFDPTFIS